MDKDDAWTFIVARYEAPGRADELLKAQDESGLDIVLHLFREYVLERLGLTLDEAQVAEAQSALALWRSGVIEPLRTIRRSLKQAERFAPVATAEAAELRFSVAQAELQAERAELNALCEWLQDRAGDGLRRQGTVGTPGN
jgi:uncharacterized protein (TIGR02444 family)